MWNANSSDNLGFGSGTPNAIGSAPANPYLQPAIDSAQGDLVRNYNLAVSPSIRSAMVRSGSFGNSGLEQMAGEADRTLQTSLGRIGTEMRYGDYWNDLNFNRQTFNDSFAHNQQNLSNAFNLLGLQNQFNQQDLANATTVQNTPLSYWSTFSNGANSIGNGFGTSSSSMNMPGSPMMGALGGWQLGSAFGKAFGTPAVTDGGYSIGQGSAYGGSYDGGMFTPYRRGM